MGDSGVGKTSILTRFTYEKFNDYSEPTLGAAFLTKKHTLPMGKPIEFHVAVSLGRSGTRRDSKSTVPLRRSTTGRRRSRCACTT